MEDDVEKPEDYGPGGFCPISIGDRLDGGRYEVVHKLGHGRTATVWLCQFSNSSSSGGGGGGDKWVAVRVNAARASGPGTPDRVAIDWRAAQGLPSAELLARHHLVAPRDVFFIDSPNGRHQAGVLPLMGPRLSDYLPLLPAAARPLACQQLAAAVGFLHARGLCHGDVTPRRALVRLRPFGPAAARDDLRELLGAPRLVPLLQAPEPEPEEGEEEQQKQQRPPALVRALSWHRLRPLVDGEAGVALAGFARSYTAWNPPVVSPELRLRLRLPNITTMTTTTTKTLGIGGAGWQSLATPETLFFGTSRGAPTEVWALAYTLMEVRLGGWPQEQQQQRDTSGEEKEKAEEKVTREEVEEEQEEKQEEGKEAADLLATVQRMERFCGPVPFPLRRPAEKMMRQYWAAKPDHPQKTAAAAEPAPVQPYWASENLAPVSGRTLEEQEGDDDDDHKGKGGGALARALLRGGLARAEAREFADLLGRMMLYNPAARPKMAGVLEHAWFTARQPRQRPRAVALLLGRLARWLLRYAVLVTLVYWCCCSGRPSRREGPEGEETVRVALGRAIQVVADAVTGEAAGGLEDGDFGTCSTIVIQPAEWEY
ncbi:kinase-like domain-containing protein [Xylariaceae sp. FL0804]|nr:kinase-like domain-containing protein [Xylariaceae sp. FL0804]